MLHWIHRAELSKVSSFLISVSVSILPDIYTDTDNKNVSGRIQIQIQMVKKATICPANGQFAGYPCIPNLQLMDVSTILHHMLQHCSAL